MTLYHILYLYMQEKKFYKKMSKPLTVTMVRLRGRGLILCFMPRRKTGTLICHKTGTLIIHYLVLSVLANWGCSDMKELSVSKCQYGPG